MSVVITLQEALDKGIWEDIANLKGYDYYAPSEGMPRDTEFKINIEDYMELIKKKALQS